MKKHYKLFPILLIVTLALTSCIFGVHERTNYYRKYKSFLNYSLGNIEDVEKEKVEYSGGAPIPAYGSFYKWHIKYKDVNGNERIFVLTNHKKTFSKDATTDEYFASQILEEAKTITEQQIKEDVLYHFYDELVFEDGATTTYLWIMNKYNSDFDGEVEYAITLTDKKTGVKLSEATPQIMVRDFDYEYYFNFVTDKENQDEIESDFEIFKKAIIETAEYLNQDTVPFKFRSRYNKSFKFEGKYNNDTKQFEFK